MQFSAHAGNEMERTSFDAVVGLQSVRGERLPVAGFLAPSPCQEVKPSGAD